MYSPEFMRFLINYQKPDLKKVETKHVRHFHFGLMDRILASVLLLNKR